ncbi:hypothetical protein [Actinomadura chibensis]|uniref:Uncharacterized protein n=1 Tax=Actinomadura chibensis TaxID=392828 RepID=A0A5D0NH78_9ACTN|nr:hypothetical protein [Actinomadura chibensis]TYB43551.1 hypothetical protein FXF69_27555 [Actinomadura chibensis]
MDLREHQNFRRLFAVREFALECILPDGYHFSDAFDTAIVLSGSGADLFASLSAEHPGKSPADIKAAILAKFALGDNFLVDYEATDLPALIDALSADIRALKIRYPWVYSNEVEAAYLSVRSRDHRRSLSHRESLEIVERLPQGVFQVADLTVGPFGVVPVTEHRCLPNALCGAELVCIDPGCPGVDHVRFRTGVTDAGRIFADIGKDVPDSIAVGRLFGDIRKPDNAYYRPDNDWGLPWLVTSGLTASEQRALLASLLAQDTDGLRRRANALLDRGASRKAPSDLAAGVSDAELLQLLLIASNKEIVCHLERLIDDGEIVLGPSETRFPIRNRHAEGGYFSSQAELSRLGVRFRPWANQTSLRLTTFLRALYDGPLEEDLSWALRNEPGKNLQDRLEHFVADRTPEEVVSSLVLVSRSQTSRAFHLVGPGRFELPSGAGNERELVQRILWKLGMPLPPPPVVEAGVLRRLPAFERYGTPQAEQDPEGIRSSGVSLFVALEELLQDTITYICWLVFADHYPKKRDQRFTYRVSWARAFANPLLEQAALARGNPRYSPDGANSLGTLIETFAMIAEMCAKPEALITAMDRPYASFPHLARHSPLHSFPFLHQSLVFDIEPASRQEIIGVLHGVAADLRAGEVAKVRNSLSHPRSELPREPEIAAACASIQQVVSALHRNGLLPNVHVRTRTVTDFIGRNEYVLQDGERRELLLSGSSAEAPWLPDITVPQLIPRGIRLLGSHQPLRLKFVDDTPFTELLDAHSPITVEHAELNTSAPHPEADEILM